MQKASKSLVDEIADERRRKNLVIEVLQLRLLVELSFWRLEVLITDTVEKIKGSGHRWKMPENFIQLGVRHCGYLEY